MIGESREKIQKIEEILQEDVAEKRQMRLDEMEKEIKSLEERVIKQAQSEAETMKRRAKEEAERIQRLALTQAHFQKDRELMKAREDKVKRIIEEVESRLIAFREEEAYRAFLKHLIIEAVEQISEQEVILYFNDLDSQIYINHLQNEIAAAFPNRKIQIGSAKADCKGGVIVENTQGTRRSENTFELFLGQAEEKIGKQLYKQFSMIM